MPPASGTRHPGGCAQGPTVPRRELRAGARRRGRIAECVCVYIYIYSGSMKPPLFRKKCTFPLPSAHSRQYIFPLCEI